MEENRENIRKILEKSSKHSAPSDMAQRVLNTWKEEQSMIREVPPLISKPVWALIIGGFTALVYWIIRSSGGAAPTTALGEFVQGLDLGFSLGTIEMQPVMLLSIAALAMMIGINVMVMNGRWRTNQLSIF